MKKCVYFYHILQGVFVTVLKKASLKNEMIHINLFLTFLGECLSPFSPFFFPRSFLFSEKRMKDQVLPDKGSRYVLRYLFVGSWRIQWLGQIMYRERQRDWLLHNNCISVREGLDPAVYFQHGMERHISLRLGSSTTCDAKCKGYCPS